MKAVEATHETTGEDNELLVSLQFFHDFFER
jgi:hypothetical protein